MSAGHANLGDQANAAAFMSLPRLAGRLTAELIMRSPQGLNCVKEYAIELRGNKIGSIENLGATQVRLLRLICAFPAPRSTM
jgi:hypothetical protein